MDAVPRTEDQNQSDTPSSFLTAYLQSAVSEALETEELRSYANHSDQLSERIAEKHQELGELLQGEGRALERAQTNLRRLNSRTLVLSAVMAVGVIVVGLTVIALIVAGLFAVLDATLELPDWELLEFLREVAQRWLLLVGVASAAAILSWLVMSLPVMKKHTNAQRQLWKVEAELKNRVNMLVRDEISTIVSGAEDYSNGHLARFTSTSAPRLVELEGARRIGTRALEEARRFVQAHETSALGLAGERGTGKTTIITDLTAGSSSTIGVYLPAPTRYEPAHFLRTVHRACARAVYEDAGGDPTTAERRLARQFGRRRKLLAALLAYGALGALLIDFFQPVFLEALSGLAVGGAFALGVAVWLVLDTTRGPAGFGDLSTASSADSLKEFALRELDRVGYTAARKSSQTRGLTLLGKSFGLEDSDEWSLQQDPFTHPEIADSFRAFLLRYRRVGHKSLIIGIDELDKAETGADAVHVVNGLKDVFHVPGSHVVIAVSEEALDEFSRRGVDARTTFDSSFDALIPVGPLLASDAPILLRARAVGFPVVGALFCYCMGLGVARDVVRVARSCIQLRARSDGDISVLHAARAVTRQRLIEVAQSTARGLQRACSDAQSVEASIEIAQAWDTSDLDLSADVIAQVIDHPMWPERRGALEASLIGYAAFAVTVVELISCLSPDTSLVAEGQRIKLHKTCERVAAAGRTLAWSVPASWHRLGVLREELSLQALPRLPPDLAQGSAGLAAGTDRTEGGLLHP